MFKKVVFCILILIVILCSIKKVVLVNHAEKGHLKPFGCCGKSLAVDESEGWPDSSYFFEKFVKQNKPILMRNAAKISPAFHLWTDEYFLKMDIPMNETVSIEQRKKEDRLKIPEKMHFHDWVRIYNSTDKYMVQDVPSYIGKDVILPPPVQCKGLKELIVTGIMWFSSGGTKSVVHTDSAENIICLYRGEKKFVIVDPHVFGKNVPIDHQEGAYSSIDVERVDFTKYTSIHEVEYYHVHMKAGDCMYIPFLWIHQVNSIGSNVAINVWWSHDGMRKLYKLDCDNNYNDSLTLDMVDFPGFEGENEDQQSDFIDEIKDMIRIKKGKRITYEDFFTIVVGDESFLSSVIGVGYKQTVKNAFTTADHNSDGHIDMTEVYVLQNSERGEEYKNKINLFWAIINASEDDLRKAEEGLDTVEDESDSNRKDEL